MSIQDDEKKLAKTIGNNIRYYRKVLGISQFKLAVRLVDIDGSREISSQAISTWERGVSVPNTRSLYILSRAFDIDIERFFDER